MSTFKIFVATHISEPGGKVMELPHGFSSCHVVSSYHVLQQPATDVCAVQQTAYFVFRFYSWGEARLSVLVKGRQNLHRQGRALRVPGG